MEISKSDDSCISHPEIPKSPIGLGFVKLNELRRFLCASVSLWFSRGCHFDRAYSKASPIGNFGISG